MCNIPIEERIEEFKKALVRLFKSHQLCLDDDDGELIIHYYNEQFIDRVQNAPYPYIKK